MLYIKPANYEDAEKEWQFVAAMPENENGLTNKWHGVTRERFRSEALPEMINRSKGLDLPEGFVPDTTLFLWNDNEIVGQFRLRHFLPEALVPGHIGYFIAKEHRGKGFATEGLRLTLAYGANIIPEKEFFLRLNKDNPASLRVMLKNGGRIVGENEEKYFVRIPKCSGIPLRTEDREKLAKSATASELLFYYGAREMLSVPDCLICRLEPDERRLFNTHLRLCGQKPMSQKRWSAVLNADVRYYGLFVDNKMIARACIEKLTDRYWEISDVRVAQEYRDRGYATAICGFVANEILSSNRIPTIRTEKDNAVMRRVIKKLGFQSFANDMPAHYQCKTASLEEMNKKWDDEIERHPGESNWIFWKSEAINNFQAGRSIPYYGILDGTIICEATAMLDPAAVQNSAGLVDAHTAYLCAFRTVSEYRGLGYFSKLFHFMIADLRQRGYNKVTLGVEPEDEKNLKLYRHWGFTEHIKTATEQYPDGTVMEVEYYGRAIDN